MNNYISSGIPLYTGGGGGGGGAKFQAHWIAIGLPLNYHWLRVGVITQLTSNLANALIVCDSSHETIQIWAMVV